MTSVHSCKHFSLEFHNVSVAQPEGPDSLEEALNAWDLPSVLQQVLAAWWEFTIYRLSRLRNQGSWTWCRLFRSEFISDLGNSFRAVWLLSRGGNLQSCSFSWSTSFTQVWGDWQTLLWSWLHRLFSRVKFRFQFLVMLEVKILISLRLNFVLIRLSHGRFISDQSVLTSESLFLLLVALTCLRDCDFEVQWALFVLAFLGVIGYSMTFILLQALLWRLWLALWLFSIAWWVLFSFLYARRVATFGTFLLPFCIEKASFLVAFLLYKLESLWEFPLSQDLHFMDHLNIAILMSALFFLDKSLDISATEFFDKEVNFWLVNGKAQVLLLSPA